MDKAIYSVRKLKNEWIICTGLWYIVYLYGYFAFELIQCYVTTYIYNVYRVLCIQCTFVTESRAVCNYSYIIRPSIIKETLETKARLIAVMNSLDISNISVTCLFTKCLSLSEETLSIYTKLYNMIWACVIWDLYINVIISS